MNQENRSRLYNSLCQKNMGNKIVRSEMKNSKSDNR